MPEPFAHHFGKLEKAISSAGQVLLFSDFDGTLVEIKNRPQDCYLDQSVKDTLRAITRHLNGRVGIVSGRSLEDLRSRINLSGIYYSGNHGLEIDGPNYSYREPVSEKLIPLLEDFISRISPGLQQFTGVWLENKRLSASIHYRLADPEAFPNIFDYVETQLIAMDSQGVFILRSGKKVIEIKPRVEWNKGTAINLLVNHLAEENVKPIVLFFGDDETDEDAFSLLREHFTVRVGAHRDSSANFQVNDPAEVHQFLSRIEAILKNKTAI